MKYFFSMILWMNQIIANIFTDLDPDVPLLSALNIEQQWWKRHWFPGDSWSQGAAVCRAESIKVRGERSSEGLQRGWLMPRTQTSWSTEHYCDGRPWREAWPQTGRPSEAEGAGLQTPLGTVQAQQGDLEPQEAAALRSPQPDWPSWAQRGLSPTSIWRIR